MFLICLLLWILFNGRITLEILLFGIAVSAAVYAVSCALFGFSIRKELALVGKLPEMAMMFCVLVREIVKSNLAVVKAVYSRKQPDPHYAEFETELNKTGTRVALADCITLTPGTITGKLDGRHYVIHCLNSEMLDGLEPEKRIFTAQLIKLDENEEATK
ncbi:MAG: Na+/H+ antiporter subunit E [Oscillospiraceae bacterium]|nr:Na+/H+ antiporter subunit E [Oscillospiraceae bacterium]